MSRTAAVSLIIDEVLKTTTEIHSGLGLKKLPPMYCLPLNSSWRRDLPLDNVFFGKLISDEASGTNRDTIINLPT
jgi:hypothetical protein